MARKSTILAVDPLGLLDEDAFWRWASEAEIPTKDAGLIRMSDPWETSRIMVRAVFDGMRRGVHQYLVTKAGQVAGTTTAELLMAYFALKCEGIQGVVVANEDDVREKVRQDILSITASVKNQRPTIISNAKVVEWDNHARCMMMTAGPQTGGRVGVGRGFALCLGTEVPLWKHPKALTILRTRFSSDHPYRLAIFEGTARGKNWWWDVWEEAEGAPGIERIELLWWMHAGYSLQDKAPEFRHYWDGRVTRRERRWAREIAKRYDGREITPNAWAWRRKYVAEQAGGDDKTADQEMPSLIEEAFEATGVSFLGEEAVKRVRRSVNAAPTPTRHRYEWGPRIEDTKLVRTIPDHATLDVWEQPDAVSGYVVAAVPAYSATQKCPDWILSAWRASRDELVQVAEFADDECGMQAFAWACKHLQASYHAPRRAFILETLGLGMGVLDEIKLLESYGWGTHLSRGKLLGFSGVSRNFQWRRPDSLTAASALQMRATPEIRAWCLSRLREQVGTGAVQPRSKPLLAEIEHVRQDGDEFIAEGREPADHRVWAAALAVWSWSKQLQPLFVRVQGQSQATSVMGRTIEDFFRGLKEKATANA